MKSLRRSLNNENKQSNQTNGSQPSPPLPAPGAGPHSGSLSRPSGKVAPPQKVIKALKTHRSTTPQELSYQEGDFWYVTSERDGWYEALSTFFSFMTMGDRWLT
jgi:bud emergence protein 1